MPRYGLIGKTLAHSYSKEIHEALGKDPYELLPMPEEAVEPFLVAREFDGINVTIPYKKTVIPFLDEISEPARKIGSVNTVVHRSDGTLFGDNTDYEGFLYIADRAGIDFFQKTVVILGTGGTSQTAQAAVNDRGAKEVIVVSRGGTVNYDTPEAFFHAEILINTTPVGMYPNCGVSPVDLSQFDRLQAVIDVIYNPSRTALLLDAEQRGITAAGGLPMLVMQAAIARNRFCGEPVQTNKVEELILQIARQKENIVLVGMPGCGKTTVGKQLAALLDREFVDIDLAIEQTFGKKPSELIEREGEPLFRAKETDVLDKICKQSGLVISTGGGAVLKAENRRLLRQNSSVVFLTRPLELLATRGRPLSKGGAALQELYETRLPLYRESADWEIANTASPQETAEQIRKELKV